jgi:hypothetical protein
MSSKLPTLVNASIRRVIGMAAIAAVPKFRTIPREQVFWLCHICLFEALKVARFLRAYFSPSWTAFQADRGRDFSVIVDGISN